LELLGERFGLFVKTDAFLCLVVQEGFQQFDQLLLVFSLDSGGDQFLETFVGVVQEHYVFLVFTVDACVLLGRVLCALLRQGFGTFELLSDLIRGLLRFLSLDFFL